VSRDVTRGTLLRLALLAGAAAASACGPPPVTPGLEGVAPDPSALLPRLADPASVYRDLGFLAKGEPVPFVASLHCLAGPTPDSTLAVFGLSLANRALSFRRSPEALEARYRVEIVFRQGPRVVAQLSSDQAVRVGDLEETRRADESVVFQHFFWLPPGRLDASVTVRDRNRLTSSEDEQMVEVPRYGEAPALSQLVPIYEGTARVSRGLFPAILVNPRATSPQGADTLRFYLEGYGVPAGTPVYVWALGADGDQVWRDTLRLDSAAAAVVSVGPRALQLGRLTFEATLPGSGDTARATALVTFSEQWALTNLPDVLSLLRFFGHVRELTAIREAPVTERAGLWRAFWRSTDPDTTTPENEALMAYFGRVEIANVRYGEGATPGWLTDRGEVYVTLGEPERVDREEDERANGGTIRWTYVLGGEPRMLYFMSDLGPQRFRLTFASRAEYQRLLERVRKGQDGGGPPH
jgi:GWxTD domain-containing protein